MFHGRSRDVRANALGFKVSAFRPLWEGPLKAMVAAVAQPYLGSIMFYAVRAAHTASGSARRSLSLQLRLYGLNFLKGLI